MQRQRQKQSDGARRAKSRKHTDQGAQKNPGKTI